MSWAEFVLRSIGFKETREYEMRMVREVAYHIYIGNHAFSKKKPKSKQAFWPIGEENSKKGGISEGHKQAYLMAMQKYQEQKNKKNG